MGVGYPLGESLVSSGAQPYPNIISELRNQGFINSRSYSLYLNDLENGHGIILFGGVDSTKYSGELAIVDVQENAQTGNFDTFTVVLSSLSFTTSGGTSNIDLDGGLPVILDSGTTLTYFPNDIAQNIYDGLGITNDPDAGPYVPCNVDTSNMKFSFTFGSETGKAIDVDLSQFVIPYNAAAGLPKINGEHACTFGIFQSGSVADGAGDILFGDTFLRSVYVVYDIDNNQIGLAQTKFDVTDSSVKEIGSAASQTVNTIPGASTVTNPASLSQANSAGLEPTDDPFASGFASDFASGFASTTVGSLTAATSHSATFKGLAGGLKTGATEAGGSSGGAAASSSSASVALRVPLLDLASFVVCGLAGVGVLLGSSVFLFMAI